MNAARDIAVGTLVQRLAALEGGFQSSEKTDSDRRLVVRYSLYAISDFLVAIHPTPGVHTAVVEMIAALWDIEKNNRTAPWLLNPPDTGAPKKSLMDATIQGRCAGLMHLLMKEGTSKEKAARAVLKHLPRDDPKTTWRTIDGWRNNVIGPADPQHEAAQESFNAMLALARARPGLTKHIPIILKAITG